MTDPESRQSPAAAGARIGAIVEVVPAERLETEQVLL